MSDDPLIFISSAKPDHALAKRIHRALSAAGLRPWCDAVDPVPRDAWREVTQRAVERAAVVLVVMTSSWHSGGPQGTAWSAAVDVAVAFAQKAEPRIPIVLVLVDGVERGRLPFDLARIVGIAIGSDDLQPLVDGVRAVLARQSGEVDQPESADSQPGAETARVPDPPPVPAPAPPAIEPARQPAGMRPAMLGGAISGVRVDDLLDRLSPLAAAAGGALVAGGVGAGLLAGSGWLRFIGGAALLGAGAAVIGRPPRWVERVTRFAHAERSDTRRAVLDRARVRVAHPPVTGPALVGQADTKRDVLDMVGQREAGLASARLREAGLPSARLREARIRLAELRATSADDEALEAAIDEVTAIKRSLRDQGRLQQGDILGDRYVLSRKLGQGGFASVWLALCEQTGQAFAVKVLHGQYNGDRTRIERLRRGARMMRQLSDVPHVVNLVSDLAEDDGWHYFVMDFLKGGDLFHAIAERRPALPHDKRIAAIIAIAEAVDAAHRRGILHRDIKPQNILLDARDVAYLTDFDLALAGDSNYDTQTGAMGSWVWAAPEQLDRPQDATTAVDIYALGMLLLFVILGAKIPSRVMRQPEYVINRLAAPAEIKTLIRECVEFEPSRRPASAHLFAERLRAAHTRWRASDTVPEFEPPDEPSDHPSVANSMRTLSPKLGEDARTTAAPARADIGAVATPQPTQATRQVEPALTQPHPVRVAKRWGRSPRILTVLLGALVTGLMITQLVFQDAAPSGDGEDEDARPLPQPTYAQELSDAKRKLRGDDVAGACKAYEALAREHPKKAEPLAGLGWCALDAKDYMAAMKHFDHALRVEEGDAWALFGRAAALEKGGQLEAAATAYVQYLARHPKGEDASIATLRLPGLRRQLKQGEEQRDRCKEIYPSDQPTELVLRGKCYTEKRKYDAAYAVFEQAIKQEPSFEPAHLWMARTAAIAKDQARVERACAAFHALAPSKPCPGL